MRKEIAVTVVVVALCSVVGFADLQLYDDFSDGSIDTSLWTVESLNSSVTETSGRLNLSMNTTGVAKHARALMAAPVSLAGTSSTVRFTWDMNLQVGSSYNTHNNGIAIGLADGTTYYTGGQRGYNNYTTGKQTFFSGGVQSGTAVSNEYSADGVGTRQVWYHYDLTVGAGAQSLTVYTYNSSWNSTPEMYVIGGTVLWTNTRNLTLPTGTGLNVRFYDETAYGNDGGSIRGTVYLDNVYTSIPEPATLSLLGIGGLALLKRRMR